jgi:hypothetical protein
VSFVSSFLPPPYSSPLLYNSSLVPLLPFLYIVTDWAVSRKRIDKHVPTNAHPTIGHPLLRNRPVNTSRSNEYATIEQRGYATRF